jgi:hypothetical protein
VHAAFEGVSLRLNAVEFALQRRDRLFRVAA